MVFKVLREGVSWFEVWEVGGGRTDLFEVERRGVGSSLWELRNKDSLVRPLVQR